MKNKTIYKCTADSSLRCYRSGDILFLSEELSIMLNTLFENIKTLRKYTLNLMQSEGKFDETYLQLIAYYDHKQNKLAVQVKAGQVFKRVVY